MPFREFSLSEKVLTRRRRMDRSLFLTVWLGVAAFCVAGGGWFYLLAISLSVAVNLLALRRGREAHVQRLFINIAVVGALGVLIIELGGGKTPALQAIGHFLVLLQACKLLERKGNRDYTQILALSALLMIPAALLDNSLLFTLALAAYLVGLCHTAMVFTLKRGLDAAWAAVLAGERRPQDVRQVAWNVSRAWPGGALRRCLSAILAVALVAGVLAFLLLPRGEALPLRLPGERSRVTGYDGQVRLGDAPGRVYQSNDVLMHVRVRTHTGPAALGEGIYIRGATFDYYRGSKWSQVGVASERQRAASLPPPASDAYRQAGVQEVTLNAGLLPQLFGTYPTFEIVPDGGVAHFLPDLSAQLSESTTHARRLAYTARFLSQPLSAEARAYLARLREHFGQVPFEPPASTVTTTDRVLQQARQWCGDLLERREEANRDEVDLLIAQRIAQRLREGYSYTLDLRGADPSRDGVEDFLFHTRRGHCEYFASAMTVMCRLLDVRARLATGFLLSEYDAGAGHYVVRGRDAHAWTEVFTPGTDWVTIDPTPPAGREVHGRVWAASLRRMLSDLEFMWYDRVIGYDEAGRRRITQWLRLRTEALLGWAGDAARTVGQSVRNLLVGGVVDRLLVWMALVLGLTGVALEALLIARGVRRSLRRRREALGPLPVPASRMKFMLRLLSLLARQGLRRSANQTPRQLAFQAHRELGLDLRVLDELVDLYYRTRWGMVPPTDLQLRRAEAQVAAIAAALAEPPEWNARPPGGSNARLLSRPLDGKHR